MSWFRLLLLAAVSSSAAAIFFPTFWAGSGRAPTATSMTSASTSQQPDHQEQRTGARVDINDLDGAILYPAPINQTKSANDDTSWMNWWNSLSLSGQLDRRSGDDAFVLERQRQVQDQPEDEQVRLALQPKITTVLKQSLVAEINSIDTTLQCGTTICTLRGLPKITAVATEVFPQLLDLVRADSKTEQFVISGTQLPGQEETLVFFYTPDYVVTPPER